MAVTRLLVCVITAISVVGAAWAQPVTPPAARRLVAIVNLDLAGNRELIALAEQLEQVVDGHAELRTKVDRALWEAPTDPDRRALAEARTDLANAVEQLGNGNYPEAIREAVRGQEELQTVSPAQAVRLYAELAFVQGKAELGLDAKTPKAKAAFALAQRLDPTFAPDEAREPPDVVDAFAKAKPTDRPSGRIELGGEGIVWIDGVDKGRAPSQFVVPAGRHVIWVTNDRLETRARAVDVAATDTPTLVEVPQVSASQSLQIERARKELALAPDATKKLVAMKRLASIVSVKDALLLRMVDGKITYQAWRSDDADRAPGFSAEHTRGKELPAKLLEDLAPPPPEPEDVGVKFPIPVDTTRWYQKSSYWAAIGFGTTAVAVGIYVLVVTLRPTEFQCCDFNIVDPTTVRR